MVLVVLIAVFVVVRLATRGYLWGLAFVLLAVLALEFTALQRWFVTLADKAGGQMLVRATYLQGVMEDAPSILARLGLSNRTRYRLMDDQGRAYLFTADKGLVQSFGDMEGAEVEIAYLERSHLMTGLHPVRRQEHMSVFDSARERHIRQVFKEYLP